MDKQEYLEDEIDLLDFIRVIYKQRIMIFVIVLASVLFASVSSLMKPKMYEAWTSVYPIEIDYNSEGSGGIGKPAISINNLIISILESRTMADRVLQQLEMNKNLIVDARKVVKEAPRVSVQQNGTIKLSIRSGDSELSAVLANAYIDNLDYFNDQLKLGAQRKIVQVIDRAVAPQGSVARGTTRKAVLAGGSSFMLSIFLVFVIEFVKAGNLRNRPKDK